MCAATELCHPCSPPPPDTMRPLPAIVRPSPARYRFGRFEFDTATRELRRDGVPVEMPARVFECLEYLIAHRGRALDNDELSHAVFRRADVSDGQLAQIVVRARRCVDDDGRHQWAIRTVPRFGYRWVADTLVVDDGEPVPADAPEVSANVGPATSLEPEPIRIEARPRRLRPFLALAVLMVATGFSLAWALRSGAGHPAPDPARGTSRPASAATLVLPTQIAGDAPSDLAWARLGLMDFLAERLRLAGLSVPPSESTLVLLGANPDTSEPGPLREQAGAALIVSSRVRREGPGWRVELDAEASDGVRYDGTAADGDLLQAARVACDRLLAALGRDAPAAGLPALGLDERLQRVKAAMLANELDSARRILLAAPSNQLDQPQLRYRLAQIDYRAGDFTAAETALDGLLAAPEAAADALFRARLLIARGGVRFRRTELAAAERDFDAALEALSGATPALNADPETGQALNGRGVARAALGREALGIADLGAARLHLLRAGDRIAVARTDANLGVIEMTRGRPAQALDYFTSALAVFERSSAVHERLVTLSALTAVHLQRLDPEAALSSADRALRLLPRTPDPTLRLAAHVDRANALIALGRLGEARVLLDDPAIAAITTPAYEQRRAQTRIELALRGGDPRAAARLADAALEHWSRLPGDDVHDWVRLRRVQAAQAADLPPGSTAEVSVTGERTLPVLLAAALLREEDAAEPMLREALALAEQRAAPAELVEVARVYVPWLIGRERLQEAGVLVGRLAPWSGRCYDCALLQWQLAEALGDTGLATEARGLATRLAGERLPPSARPGSVARAPVSATETVASHRIVIDPE